MNIVLLKLVRPFIKKGFQKNVSQGIRMLSFFEFFFIIKDIQYKPQELKRPFIMLAFIDQIIKIRNNLAKIE